MRSVFLFTLLSCLAATEAMPPERLALRALISNGERWLVAQQQPNGAFLPGNQFALGITELALDAMVHPPATTVPPGSPAVDRAVRFILSYRQDDGGFYDPVEGMAVYGTSLAIIALRRAERLDPAVALGARDFLLRLHNRDPLSDCLGGIGFMPDHGAGNEDLHNTSHAIEALSICGLSASDPRGSQLLAFLERCQNRSRPGEPDRRPWVTNDGGGVYSPSQARAAGDWQGAPGQDDAPPRLASYGSMTCALISSYLALDLPADDPRVVAALGWIRTHYSVSENPRMPAGKTAQGLYYHNATLAKTLSLLRITTLDTSDGRRVDWRADLHRALRERATPVTLPDGTSACFWINADPRWAEGVPHLCTAYAIGALKRIDASW